MISNVLTTGLKQLLQLLSRQPDIFTLKTNIDVRHAIVVLIDQKRIRISHYATSAIDTPEHPFDLYPFIPQIRFSRIVSLQLTI